MTERPLVELRLRTRVPDEELQEKIGKVLTPADFNLVPTGDVKILKPDGKVLCIYRRGIIPPELREAAWPILHSLKNETTTNRGLAGGTPRVQGPGSRSYGKAVPSALLGAFEPQGPRKFCRLTAWTGEETEKYRELWPLLEFIGQRMLADAPDRYANQMAEVVKTHPDWVIPGTPFSTVTCNNSRDCILDSGNAWRVAGLDRLSAIGSAASPTEGERPEGERPRRWSSAAFSRPSGPR